jgi:hypothetical protein
MNPDRPSIICGLYVNLVARCSKNALIPIPEFQTYTIGNAFLKIIDVQAEIE